MFQRQIEAGSGIGGIADRTAEAELLSDELRVPLQLTRPRRIALGAVAALCAASMAIVFELGTYFWVAVGSALGGVARHWFSGLAARLWGETFPWGTLLINIIGSFAIGFFGTLTGPDGRVFVGSTARQFFMVGVCGGYTTFSSFSLQTLNLANDGDWLKASSYVIGSVVLCLVAVWAGYAFAAVLNNPKLS